MTKRNQQPEYVQTTTKFPLAKNISDLVGMPLLLTKWEIVQGKDRDYYRMSLTHRDTGQRYIVGTNATTVVEQLSCLEQEPNPPELISFAQLGKMYVMCSYDILQFAEPPESTTDETEQPTDQ